MVRFLSDGWQQPGDSIDTAEDERRVIEAHGALTPEELGDAIRRPIAVVLDQLLRTEERLRSLEPGGTR